MPSGADVRYQAACERYIFKHSGPQRRGAFRAIAFYATNPRHRHGDAFLLYRRDLARDILRDDHRLAHRGACIDDFDKFDLQEILGREFWNFRISKFREILEFYKI